LIFKSSLYKANRTSKNSFRGIGYSKGLEILNKIKSELDLMILTDVHEDSPLDEIADVVDIFQTPAFLCRQTNFIQNVASHNIPVNIKKGQFLSPWEMSSVVEKAKSTGNEDIMVCERGFSFGYNNLISDMRSLVIMRDTNCPVVFDATHSTQLPGLNKDSSSGQSQFIAPLARAAISVGISGIFMETHPNPAEALCDGMNSLPLDSIEKLLITLKNIDDVSKE
jgi:2-dehydro-3-deoxyphosphooctonate aldolase (KDO 8-P synthase)